MIPTYDWKQLMSQWNDQVITSQYREILSPETIKLGWLGYSGASEEQLVQTEARLGKTLPPSYRQFLEFSNGWGITTPFIHRLWSTDKIEWFAVRRKELFGPNKSPKQKHGESLSVPDELYFVYGEEQNESIIREEYLETALEISDLGSSAFYLLNPRVINEDDEWEAWFFATWLPGANRYRTFWELMQAEYERFLQLKDEGPI